METKESTTQSRRHQNEQLKKMLEQIKFPLTLFSEIVKSDNTKLEFFFSFIDFNSIPGTDLKKFSKFDGSQNHLQLICDELTRLFWEDFGDQTQCSFNPITHRFEKKQEENLFVSYMLENYELRDNKFIISKTIDEVNKIINILDKKESLEQDRKLNPKSIEEINHPGFPTTIEGVHLLCKEYDINDYIINSDLSIDVEGDVILSERNLKYIPLNFRFVSEDFECQYNNLISLEGCPKEVGGYFNCDENNLTSLEGAPSKVAKTFCCNHNILTSLEFSPKKVEGLYCYENNLTSLKGGPEIVTDSYTCWGNQLETLEGSPKVIGGDFLCDSNKLTSLKGGPEKVNGIFRADKNKLMSLEHIPSGIDYSDEETDFYNNPIYSLIEPFFISLMENSLVERKENIEGLVSKFNEYSIVRGDKVVLGRLKTFIEDFDLEMPYMDKVKKYYKII